MNSLSFEKESPCFAIDLASRPNGELHMVIGSFNSSKENWVDFVNIIDGKEEVKIRRNCQFPASSIKIAPQVYKENTEYFLTTCDVLTLNEVTPDHKITFQKVEVNKTNYPLTYVDWYDNYAVAACSDCTVMVVDMHTMQIKTRLLAHDHPIYCTAFCGNDNVFCTAGYDGSLREFDIRDLSSFNILYQVSSPILRCKVEPSSTNTVAFFTQGSTGVTFLDRRYPLSPVGITNHCENTITGIGWSQKSGHLFSCDERGEVRQTDVSNTNVFKENSIIHLFDSEVNSLAVSHDHIALAIKNRIDLFTY